MSPPTHSAKSKLVRFAVLIFALFLCAVFIQAAFHHHSSDEKAASCSLCRILAPGEAASLSMVSAEIRVFYYLTVSHFEPSFAGFSLPVSERAPPVC